MADVLPTQSAMGMDIRGDSGTAAPLPNPPFVFPFAPADSDETGKGDRESSGLDNTSSQRVAPRSRPQRLSFNALPAFDFGPSASSSVNVPPSPSRSPSRRTPPAYHPAGHRRNGSEYVGGDLTHGGPMLVSTSPTKSEHSGGHRRKGSDLVIGDATNGNIAANSTEASGSWQPQEIARLGPSSVKRGHAHRRSGAISSHDLSTILKPSADARTGSAPTTPSDPMFQNTRPSELDRSASQPVLNESNQPFYTPQPHDNSNTGSQPRPRARFSEKIDYIPRPLSTISSETSSTMSTVRASHSVTNSISSIVGASVSTSPGTHHAIYPRQDSLELDLASESDQANIRPRTAEPTHRTLSSDWKYDFTEPGITAKRPLSAPLSDSLSNALGAQPIEPLQDNISFPTQVQDVPSSHRAQRTHSSFKSVDAQFPRRLPLSPTIRPRTSPEPKVTKRQSKGRSWVGLLSRKARHQDFEDMLVNHRSPTPPSRQATPEMQFSLDNVNFDEDTTYIIETGTPYTSRSPRSTPDLGAGKLQEISSLPDPENQSSILDIDAAMGSYDAEGTGPACEEVVGAGSCSTNKRPMHSSGATGGFAGPGMHYHRRADSAPEMDAIDRSRFGFPRLGSNPAMAIEEEEEEEDEEEAQGLPGQVDTGKEDQPAVTAGETSIVTDLKMRRAGLLPARTRRYASELLEGLNPVEIVEAEEEPRFSVVTKSSGDSTITPSMSDDPLDTNSASVSADYALPQSALPYEAYETVSSVSSPDFTKTSFDTPRMHTATSSITDRATLSSSRAGDQGSALHSSIDDVPSLTSSASTMSAHPTRFSSSANSAADRSSSLSAAVPARTRPVSSHKRLSLASLSRLTGGSYNKSKLNIEESAPDDTIKRAVKKNGNRISRMMKFWKSKQKVSHS